MSAKINVISIGNFRKNDEYSSLFGEYKKRIKWEVNLIELKNSTVGNAEEQKIQEGKEIAKHINKNYKTLVLDERGKIITTNEFTDICNSFIGQCSGINFIIGGSDGLSKDILAMSDFTLSFGKMVFPHLLVRVLLIEQLYRVYTINNGHPYHK